MSNSTRHNSNRRKHPSRRGPIEVARIHSILSLIAPSTRLNHSGSSLWNHLLGTFEIMTAWGAKSDQCIAGLIHSIYGTQYFRTPVASITARESVSKVVGVRAERLAYLFCVVDRPALRRAVTCLRGERGVVTLPRSRNASPLRLSASLLRDLRLIDLANESEQRERRASYPDIWFTHVCTAFRSIGFTPSHVGRKMLSINEQRERQLLQNYIESINATVRRSAQLLADCIEAAPQCAEARLLLAAAQLREGDVILAYENARRGVNDLRGWGVAWDTRIPFMAWNLMGIELTEAARVNSRTLPPITNQALTNLRRASQ